MIYNHSLMHAYQALIGGPVIDLSLAIAMLVHMHVGLPTNEDFILNINS